MSDGSGQQGEKDGEAEAGHETVTFVPHVPDEVHGEESDSSSSDGDADGSGDTGVDDENDDEGVASTAGYIPLMLGTNDENDAAEREDRPDHDEDENDDEEEEEEGEGERRGAAQHAASRRVEAQGQTRQFTSTMALAMQIRAEGTIEVDPVEPKHASGEDFSLPDDHVDTIKNCMASFSLPTPPGMSMADMDAAIARVVQQSQQRQNGQQERADEGHGQAQKRG